MRRGALLALLLLALATAVMLLLQGGGPDQSRDDVAEEAAGHSTPGAGRGAGGEGAAGAPDLARTAAEVEDPADPAEPSAGHAGPWLNVRVTRGEPELPVPGARVTVFTPEEDRQLELMTMFLTGVSVPDLLSAQGDAYVADAEGCVRLPLPEDHGLIAAEHGEGFAIAEFDPSRNDGGDREETLRLEPAHSVLIRVVDESGAPVAGAQVAIRFGDENFHFDLLRDHTGADGLARMRHALVFLDTFSPGLELPCYAALPGPWPQPVQAPLDRAATDEKPIELVMPPAGLLEVRTTRAGGAAAPDGQIVYLSRPKETAEDDDDFFVPGLPGFESVAERVTGGKAVFRHVPLSVALEATTVFDDAPEASKARGAGPGSAGATAVIELVESLDYPVLTGRLLGPGGVPLALQRAELRIPERQNEFGMDGARDTRTGADGSFRIAMRSSERIGAPQPAEFLVPEAEGGALLARFDIPPLRPGENPVGDLTAALAPVLVAGRVLSSGGVPLPAATVCRMNWVQWDEDDPAQGQWMPDWGEERTCGGDGSFILLGEPPREGLRLVADAPGHLRRELDVEPGARGLEIVLQAGGTLRGRILADKGVPLDGLNLALEMPASGFEDALHQWSSPDADGRFAFSGLPAGVARLSVQAGWSGDGFGGLARIEGIAVGPDAAPDPRLDPIDLRGRVHVCTVRARGEDGTALEDVRAWREDEPDFPFHGWLGEVVVLSDRPLGRLVVHSPGWRDAVVDASGPVITATLRRGLELRFHVPAADARRDGARLGLQLIEKAERSAWGEEQRGFFDAAGNLTLRVSAPGEYYAVFLVAGEEGEDSGFGWVEPEPGAATGLVAVRDASGPQEIVLPPPSREAIRRALEDE